MSVSKTMTLNFALVLRTSVLVGEKKRIILHYNNCRTSLFPIICKRHTRYVQSLMQRFVRDTMYEQAASSGLIQVGYYAPHP